MRYQSTDVVRLVILRPLCLQLLKGDVMAIHLVECPECLREYKVGDKHMGRKVACANPECGASFVAIESTRKPATLPDLETDTGAYAIQEQLPTFEVSTPEIEPKKQPSGEIQPIEGSVPPTLATVPPVAPPPIPAANGRCYRSILGRLLFFIGMTLILTAAVTPSVVPVRGEFRSVQTVHNLSAASTKLSAGILGIALLIAGSVFWSGSRISPTMGDVIFVSLVIAALTIVTLKQLTDLMAQPLA
jgi:hypothetical protein